ncbi:hypothetical protein GCM10027176_08150 [Actinoallomurus bryophytorum]|nr:hypothetical protein [Actinoallomurus bryophytorum]
MRAGRAAAGIGVAVLALAACGGSGSGGSSGTSAAATPTPTAAAIAGHLTPPGTHLKFGQPATAGWVPTSLDTGTAAHKALKLQVTVRSVEKGTIADFKNVRLKSAERTSTPYYVKVRIKALGSTPPSGTNDDPDVTIDAIDDRGQQQSNIIFLGTFARCDDARPPKPFANGKSYDSCLAYLMPGGGSIQKVQWNSGPSKANEVTPYFDKPIVWAAT